MELPEGVVLLDSLGDLQPANTSPILVCGSHCGGSRDLARHVKNCHVKAVFLNNAGVGKNQAGIRGLTHYQAENILACAVDHYSAEIGIARDTWESGIISHMSSQAAEAGIQIGDAVQVAVAKITDLINLPSLTQKNKHFESLVNEKEENSSKVDLKKQIQTQIDGVGITVTDSITFLNENNSGDIVVCGSHGGLSAGEYARKHRVKAVFFNDAGIGKNSAGVKSLESLSDAGILACTVDCMSAEIFNGLDTLGFGIITVCNQLAKTRNINEKMTVKEAIKYI
jgi:predicted amino acid-binding ACT domain protein